MVEFGIHSRLKICRLYRIGGSSPPTRTKQSVSDEKVERTEGCCSMISATYAGIHGRRETASGSCKPQRISVRTRSDEPILIRTSLTKSEDNILIN